VLTYNAYAAPSAKAPLEPLLSIPVHSDPKNTTKQPRSNIMNKHMKIVVIGGSGLIGTKLVNNLRRSMVRR